MASKSKGKFRSYPNKHKYTQKLQPGVSGFLCTCNSKFREKDCLRESYNLLNEFADDLFGPLVKDDKTQNSSEADETSGVELDIETSLAKEVESIKAEVNEKPELRRFQAIESGANGIVFIKTTVPDPVKLAHTIVCTYSKGVQKSKFILRLLPVEVTCKAYLEDICIAAEPLIEKYFSGQPKTFAVVFNHRNNDRLCRDEVIEKLAGLVYRKSNLHKTDLKQPELVILLEVIRSICCLSVVPDYYLLKKYNLLENALKGNNVTSFKENEETANPQSEENAD